MKKIVPYLLIPICSALSFWMGQQGQSQQSDLESQIMQADKVENLSEDWGKLILYTPENGTTTYGTRNTLTAVAIIDPGQEIHPPHEHAAEEFLYVVEGSGTWSLNGKEQAAQAGDMLYAKPWDIHGIKNTGSSPLTFFVVKWDNKGVPLPVKEGK